jgi:hypothetical protein
VSSLPPLNFISFLVSDGLNTPTRTPVVLDVHSR